MFVHHRDSMTHLADLLVARRRRSLLFAGGMSGPQKDAAVATFRDRVPVLLCTESGGEGRNLQFCNTLINFDIPWNPMAIEQRIGRIDRIGQTREVFVFNLVTAGTIEDAVLRILDEKINMFELVVGEVGAILGEVDEQQEFSTLVLDAWLHGHRAGARERLCSNSRTSCSPRGGITRGSSSSTKRCSGAISMPPDLASHEQGRMQGFVAALLRHEGALVEAIDPEGLEVLAPPPVQHSLGIGELARLGFGATLPPAAQRVGLEGDWLDRFAQLLGSQGRWTRRVVSARRPRARRSGAGARATNWCSTTRRFGCSGWRRPGRAIWCWISAPPPSRTTSATACCAWASIWRPARLPDAVLAAIVPALDAPSHDRGAGRGPVTPADAELPATGTGTACSGSSRGRCRPGSTWSLEPFVKGLRRRLGRDQDRLHRLPQRPLPRGDGAAPLPSPEGGPAAPTGGTAGGGDRARISRQARRSRTTICHARDGRLGPDAGSGDAGASLYGADPAAQGRAGDHARLEPVGAAAGDAGLRCHRLDRAAAPGVRRRAASRRSGSAWRHAPVAAARFAARATVAAARNAVPASRLRQDILRWGYREFKSFSDRWASSAVETLPVGIARVQAPGGNSDYETDYAALYQAADIMLGRVIRTATLGRVPTDPPIRARTGRLSRQKNRVGRPQTS